MARVTGGPLAKQRPQHPFLPLFKHTSSSAKPTPFAASACNSRAMSSAEGAAHVLELLSQPLDCAFHGSDNLLASATVEGDVTIFDFRKEDAGALDEFRPHGDQPVRAISFLGSGHLVSGAKCGGVVVSGVEDCKEVRAYAKALPAAVTRVHCLDESTVAVGGEDGTIAVFDVRASSPVCSFRSHTDFIGDMWWHADEKRLIAVSGDGTVSLHDARKGKKFAQSETDADDEMLSVAVMRRHLREGGTKVVIGCQSGVISLFSYGFWNDCSDRFPGHPSSVDAIVKYDDDLIITGSADGLIRVLSILPNKMLGVVGEHTDFPIERLAITPDRCWLASASHNNTVKLWDISDMLSSGSDEEGKAEGEPVAGPRAAEGDAAEGSGRDDGAGGRDPEGDSGESDSDGADEASSSSTDEEPGDKKKRKKKQRGKGMITGRKEHKRKQTGSFFADL